MKSKHTSKKYKRKALALFAVMTMALMMLTGCGQLALEESENDQISSENIVLTEQGEVLEKENSNLVVEKEPIPSEGAAGEPQNVSVKLPEEETTKENTETKAPMATATPTPIIMEPEQEQVITEEDQIEPTERALQLVFLGDSIFDNNRDGTGVPYLTSVQCDADVYNLAIGGTSATIEMGEEQSLEKWTSRGLAGVTNAITEKIPTDIFEGTRAKEILDNPNIDFTQTDYFIIEYGLNDFFRGAPRDGFEHPYDVRCYVGALRYAVSELRSYAPDATIVLCAPNFAQFYDSEGWMIGDGNTLNTGYGTLFDYKGTCEYVSNEMNTLFLDAYLDLGITSYTAEEYLEDGVHLTAAGRQLYADALARIINDCEETKNN